MRTISQQIGTALTERKAWTLVRWVKEGEIGGREIKLLDYACGTGAITRALGPWVTNVRGVDISENMVAKYNQEATAAGLKPEQVSAVQGDFLAETVDEKFNAAEWQNFDVIAIGLGFHHFENPLAAVKKLSERLKPETGILLIVDFLPFDDEEQTQTQAETIKKRGFTRSNIEKLFKLAALEKFSFSVVDDPAVMQLQEGTKKRTMFIARGQQPPTFSGKLWKWLEGIQNASAQQFQLKPGGAGPTKLGIAGEKNSGPKYQTGRFLG